MPICSSIIRELTGTEKCFRHKRRYFGRKPEKTLEDHGREKEDYMDEVRIRAITESVRRRIENLFQFAMSHTPTREYTTEDDVEGNIAADYASKVEL